MQHISFSTEFGDVVIELLADAAPKTSQYFARLAETDAFASASVLRIVTSDGRQTNDSCPINIVQIAPGERFDSPRHAVIHEDTRQTGLTHTRWTVSAARFSHGELYGSFFICLADEPELDYGGKRQPDGQGFAAFGRVVSGFEALQKIFSCAESTDVLSKEIPVRALTIKTAAE